ncbi:MAG: tRNA-dihydrouridine synthase, partial [Candidatus Paceibacterota bacterium]
IAFAEELKKRVSIPLIYSGDVDEKNADELLKKFDFVMIGRKALGYPNIFAKLTGKKRVFGFDKYLKLALKYDLRFGHIKSQAINFTRFNEGSGKIRKQLAKTRNLDELKEVLGMK